NDTARIELSFMKKGYFPGASGGSFIGANAAVGRVWAVPLFTIANKAGFASMRFPPLSKTLEDPGYDDAVKVWKEQMKFHDDYMQLRAMQKTHPEVNVFYTTESKQRQIVFLKNGTVEKYGYPDGPTVADMETKYGTLPDYMKVGG